VIGLPGTPSTPQATAGNATATVTWTQAAANGSPLDDVQIESDQVPAQSIGVTSTFAYSGLTNGVAHRFRVRAHNEAGWGEWSEYSAPVTPDIQPGRPAAPASVFADGALLVSWSAPSNEGSAITGYELTIGGGASSVVQLGNLTSYTWSGLTNGVSYQFSVVAVNAAGQSQPSSFSNVEHPLREPAAPGTPTAVQGDGYLDLSWARAADNGDPVIEYQVEQQSNPGVFVPVSGAAMRWSNLPNGVAQQFRVRARNRDVDWGVWSGVSAPVTPCGVPDAPGAPGVARGDQQAIVTWAVPGDQGCAIDQYQVSTSGGTVQGAGASPHTFTGLSNGTGYQFEVRAHNTVGWGAYSALSASVTPAGAPVGPASITATSAAVGAVDLSWPAASANGSPVTAYQVSANGGAARNVGVVTSYRWGALANGTAYSFRVQACNDVACGAWSAADSATTWGEPAQPSPPSVSAGDATLTAGWTAPAANGSAISSYNVELDPGAVTANPDRSKTWNGLANGTTYRVRVQACNAVGCGAWSGYTSGTPTSPISVTIAKGASAVGQPGCSTSGCAWVTLNASGLTANTTFTVTCHGDATGAFSGSSTTTDGSGRIVNNRPCYYGFTGTNFWVTVNSHQSNVISW
jgi:hypothetical protein